MNGSQTKSTTPTLAAPKVTSDPRFRAGRTLVQTGKSNEGGIDMFATLLEETRQKYGDASIESASCYYEYGNALFRGASRAAAAAAAGEEEKDAATESKTKVSAAATAAEERKRQLENDATPESKRVKVEDASTSSSSTTTKTKQEEDKENSTPPKKETKEEENEKDDVQLALEMMENAYSILDEYTSSSSGKDYQAWAKIQLPRILCGLGDVFSFVSQHADAVDVYTRAIPYREEAVEDVLKEEDKQHSIVALTCRRQLVEAYVLVAEELLACCKDDDDGEDVVTTESKVVLVKAEEKVEYARGYYDKARDELQEAVFLMGKIAASGQDLGTEKEDVCFLATMLMGVGNTLAEMDEKEEEKKKPATKI
mmetsp:Transcript_18317/g.26243  ORF Transcript_18317/g.26243 Transcript_18317/m.26243 type:complete len:369 (+) Transcript_18317:162-1268(+)